MSDLKERYFPFVIPDSDLESTTTVIPACFWRAMVPVRVNSEFTMCEPHSPISPHQRKNIFS